MSILFGECPSQHAPAVVLHRVYAERKNRHRQQVSRCIANAVPNPPTCMSFSFLQHQCAAKAHRTKTSLRFHRSTVRCLFRCLRMRRPKRGLHHRREDGVKQYWLRGRHARRLNFATCALCFASVLLVTYVRDVVAWVGSYQPSAVRRGTPAVCIGGWCGLRIGCPGGCCVVVVGCCG
jgi:hypothetical protein